MGQHVSGSLAEDEVGKCGLEGGERGVKVQIPRPHGRPTKLTLWVRTGNLHFK